jgi:phage terminase Nu1 subunit (DNA packaging protein)
LQSSKSDDPLLAEGDSPGLERYRLAKAEHAELDLAERRGDLIERDKCREVLARWAVVIRRMGERLAKRYGTAASTEVIDTLKECESVVMEAMADADDTATD